MSERAFVSLSLTSGFLSLTRKLDYIWRRNPCMEAKIKEREKERRGGVVKKK